MLAFLYPQHLDTLLSWSALPLLTNLTKAVLQQKFTYVYTLHQLVFQPNKAVRPLYENGSRILYYPLYRCPNNNVNLAYS